MDIDNLKYIAKTYGTPTYVFDLDILKEHIDLIRKSLDRKISLCFAIKANPFLVKELDSLIDKYEVCSPGEWTICQKSKIDSKKIVLSGVNKEKEKFNSLLQNGEYRGIITIESHNQLIMLDKCAADNHCKIKVLLRLTSGNQFGMDEDTIVDIIKNQMNISNICIVGIQYYSGTQKKTMKKVDKELKYLDEFCAMLKDKYGYEVAELEYGPGLLVPNFMDMIEGYSAKEMLIALDNSLKGISFKGHITLEMGRFLTAFCGEYLTSIVDKKQNKARNYVIVDGGLNHVNFYGQVMGMRTPIYEYIPKTSLDNEKECAKTKDSLDMMKESLSLEDKDIANKNHMAEEKWDICGSLCTVNDILVKELPISNVELGDIIVFKNVGAYAMTEGMSLFLSRDLPRIITYSNDEKFRVKREAYTTTSLNS